MSTSSSAGDNDTLPADESFATTLPGVDSSPIIHQSGLDATAESALKIAEEAAAFDPTWWPSDQALLLLNYINGLDVFPCYAYAIGATTIAFRTLLFPLFVKAQRNSSRMAHMQPELAALKDQLDALGDKVDQAQQQKYMMQTKALFKKYDCNPLSSLIAPLASAPIFMSMFFGLRNGADIFPELFQTGGMYWFTDLSAPDPYGIMPVLSACTFLAMTETGKEQMMASDPNRGKVMLNLFRGLAVIMVPITWNFNSAVFVYWVTNNTWSLGQTVLLKQPSVKKALGIWDPPKPVPGKESKGLFDEIANAFKSKEQETNALSAEKVKAHNQIIEQQKRVHREILDREGIRKGKGRRRK